MVNLIIYELHFLFLVFFFLFLFFVFVFETGPAYTALLVLEFAMQTRLASNL